jgi:hypothetical protein
MVPPRIRQRWSFPCFVVAVLACWLLPAHADQSSPFDIQVDPISLERKTTSARAYGMENGGLTEWFFHCSPLSDVEKVSGKTIHNTHFVTVRVRKVHFRTSLEVRVTLPPNPPAALVDHEEGHVRLCKSVYSESSQAALDCAKDVIKRDFSGQGNSEDRAYQSALDASRMWFCEKYTAATDRRLQKLSDRYDEITQHGQSATSSKEAVEEVLR